MRFDSKLMRYLLWILPLLTVFVIFREFLFGPPHFQVDSGVCFISNHYFLENLARGVYTFWNPFNAWGRPEDFTLQMNGVFNPFLYLPLVLQFLGLGFIAAYKCYVIAYFAFGLWGFYLLSRRLFEEEWQAYLAFLLLLYSNLWINLFNDALIILIFIPSVWFFYFAISFFKEYRLRDYLGMAFALMMILTTYLPFFFLLTALFIVIFYVLFYFGTLGPILAGTVDFVRKYPGWAFLGMGLVVLYAVPGFLWMHFSPDYAVSWRGAPDADPLKLSFAAIDHSPAVAENAFQECLTGQSVCGSNYYVSVYGLLLAGLALFVSIGRRTLFFVAVAISLVLTVLGSAAPLYGLLAKTVFFMKYFRNTHFFIWFTVPFIILAVTDLAGRFFSSLTLHSRPLTAGFLVAVHSLIAVFFALQGDTSLSTWVTIILSLAFSLMVLTTGFNLQSKLFLIGLFVLVAVQPVGVFRRTTNDWGRVRFPAKVERYQKLAAPAFSYLRPYRGDSSESWSEAPGFGETADTSGYSPTDFQGMKWAYLFQNKLPYDAVKDYVRHKFVVYDQVSALPDTESSFAIVGESIRDLRNVAYVQGTGLKLPPSGSDGGVHPQMIDGDIPEFRVVSFDLDRLRLKTNFRSGHFLVYNDSYHPLWRARINGKATVLYRANIAFKGLYLPPGENDIVLTFPTPWLAWLFPSMILLSLGIFAYLVFLFCRPQRALIAGRAG